MKNSTPSLWRRLVTGFLGFTLLAWPVGATWSIVAVNIQTGEVVIASATCLANFDLQNALPVVVVGKGAGAAQAAVDITAVNRAIIFDGLQAGRTPQEILDDLRTIGTGNYQSRQYGISAFSGDSVTHTGNTNGLARKAVKGSVGNIRYAIQGNVLAGDEVVFAAETAFTGATGDLGQRVMAGMEAARATGGDGRCSCDNSDPTGCGAPPEEFDFSAYVAFMVLARMGDTDGDCTQADGCAGGEYYFSTNIIGGMNDPDPVFRLQDDYDAWRASLAGRPDHLLSTVTSAAQSVPADGITTTTLTVSLVDVEGVPLAGGGADVQVQTLSGGTTASVGALTDHGDGTYSFAVTAGTTPGTESFVITADDGTVKATLYPYPTMRVDAVTPIHVGFDQLTSIAGGTVPLVINEPLAAGAPYLILASASGTDPGYELMGIQVPLNFDEVFERTFAKRGRGLLPGTVGLLDENGHGEGSFVVPPGLLINRVGMRLDWAAVLMTEPLSVTNAAGFDIIHGTLPRSESGTRD